MSSEFTFDHAKLINDGGYWICLKLSDFSAVQLVRVWISRMLQDSKYIMTLKKYTEKRSLSANAYAWSLMTGPLRLSSQSRMKGLGSWRETVVLPEPGGRSVGHRK